MPKTRSAILMGLLAILLILGCSHSGINPVEPPDSPDEPAINKTPDSQRVLWGIWNISFDPVEYKVILQPSRTALAHFNITDWLLPPACDDCLKIAVNSFDQVTRILDADVTLRNPTGISGYDIRGILYTNDYGHLLKNADAWTDLWDIPGGEDINPFKAFAKTEPNRIFEPDAEYTENYLIYIPTPPNWNQITFAVDASWPNNCREPYDITNFSQDDIYNFVGSSGNISIDVLDWQDDVDSVILKAPVITGEAYTPLTHQGGNTWAVELVNVTGTLSGEYSVLISATSTGSGDLTLYDFVEITISEMSINLNPEFIETRGLTFNPRAVTIDGDYAYIASGDYPQYSQYADGNDNEMHIFDITDPENPVWVNKVETVYTPINITISGGYAFAACMTSTSGGCIHIIDIDPPESANLVKSVLGVQQPLDIAVSNGYAYAVGPDLYVIDIDPVEEASVINFVDLADKGSEIEIDGDYAYAKCRGNYSDLEVIDLQQAESPVVVASVNTDETNNTIWGGLAVSNGYAYLGGDYITIVDVDPPAAADVVHTIEMPACTANLAASGDYLYAVTPYYARLHAIDIQSPETAYITGTVDLPRDSFGVTVRGDYAYVGGVYNGLLVVDISVPQSPDHKNTILTFTDVRSVAVSDGNAFVTDIFGTSYFARFKAVDVDPPETTTILWQLHDVGGVRNVISEGYAYLPTSDALLIVDIDPLESPHLVNVVDLPDHSVAVGVSLYDGYAFVGYGFIDYGAGISIIDVDPPESAYTVNEVELAPTDFTGQPRSIAVSDGYAFITGPVWGWEHKGELRIIDIMPPESAHEVNTVTMELWGLDLEVVGGYAFVANAYDGLAIIDVDPPGSAYILDNVGEPDDTFHELALSAGYAYVGDGIDILQVIDIDPPDLASVVQVIDFPYPPYFDDIYDVFVSEEYAYIATGTRGLDIIKLW